MHRNLHVSTLQSDRCLIGSRKVGEHRKSDDKLWVVEVIAPFGGADAMVADLKAKVLPERKLRMLTLRDGRREVRVV